MQMKSDFKKIKIYFQWNSCNGISFYKICMKSALILKLLRGFSEPYSQKVGY